MKLQRNVVLTKLLLTISAHRGSVLAPSGLARNKGFDGAGRSQRHDRAREGRRGEPPRRHFRMAA